MAKEIERKFLLIGEIPYYIGQPKLIKQAYIFVEPSKHLRLRLVDGVAILGLKYTDSGVRDEFEYEIPYDDGIFMYKKSNLTVEKIRFSWDYKEIHFDLDIFPNGIKYVEAEFSDEDSANSFIADKAWDWLGEEITNNPQYSNIILAKGKLSFNKK